MGTVNLKMKLSAILIAAVSASPVAHDKHSSVAKSGKPMSGKPNDMRPMTGHYDGHGEKDQDGHDMDHDMEEEWKEFQDLMRHGKADNNIMNVNLLQSTPINKTGSISTLKLKPMLMLTLVARKRAKTAEKWKTGKKNSIKDTVKTNTTWK